MHLLSQIVRHIFRRSMAPVLSVFSRWPRGGLRILLTSYLRRSTLVDVSTERLLDHYNTNSKNSCQNNDCTQTLSGLCWKNECSSSHTASPIFAYAHGPAECDNLVLCRLLIAKHPNGFQWRKQNIIGYLIFWHYRPPVNTLPTVQEGCNHALGCAGKTKLLERALIIRKRCLKYIASLAAINSVNDSVPLSNARLRFYEKKKKTRQDPLINASPSVASSRVSLTHADQASRFPRA